MEKKEGKKPVKNLPAKTTPADLIAIAISENVDVEKLEKLMELQERYDKNLARKSFLSAMTNFQGSVPVLEKKKKVAFGNTKYSYADLGEMAETLKDVLKANGITYRWEMEEEAERFKCTCIISHVDGYSERTSLTAGKDTTGNKNDIQAIASAVKYLQRYTFIGALGLTTADEDVDGRTQPLKSVDDIIPKQSSNKKPTDNKSSDKSNPYIQMRDAKSLEEVKKIWSDNKPLQTEKLFVDGKNKCKAKFEFISLKKKLEDCIIEDQLKNEYNEVINSKEYKNLNIEQKEELTKIKNDLLKIYTEKIETVKVEEVLEK